MRVFFIVDPESSVKPHTLQRLLELNVPRTAYEILPLKEEWYVGDRKTIDRLFDQAREEGLRVLLHYPAVARCLIILRTYLPNVVKGKEELPIDYVLIMTPQGVDDKKILNSKHYQGHYMASAPCIQPDLVEAAIELAQLESPPVT